MRKFFLAFVAFLALLPAGETAEASRVGAVLPIQTVFLGDRTCLDDARDCLFSGVVPNHRYLHVILDDLAGNADWQVQVSSPCSDAPRTVAGGIPIAESGFLESVVDLASLQPPLVAPSICFIFRGRNHWAVTYYAAYFDDTPTPDASILFPHYQTQLGRPDLPDLDVLYIHRSPTYNYDAARNNPEPGDQAKFTAHFANSGGEPVDGIHYEWLIDGRLVLTGDVLKPLAPGEQATEQLPWRWGLGPHEVTFRLVPAGDEISTTNNSLTIRTDALALGFWLEQGALDYFDRYQWTYCSTLSCAGSDSFADWLQRQVSAWNSILAAAVFPGLAPTGAADRIRVDEVTVVPDGALPLHGPRATNTPDDRDHTVDLEWGLPAQGVDHAYPHMWDGPFNIDWATIHELSHARSLADLYRFDVGVDGTTVIDVKDHTGQPVYNPADPMNPEEKLHGFTATDGDNLLYQNEEQDLMSCVCTPSYSAYDALVLNRIRGRRAQCGNFNAPCNLGDWYLDLPRVNELRILDSAGQPLPDGTQVIAYYDGSNSYTAHTFQQAGSATFVVQHGLVNLGTDPFHAGKSRYLAGHNLLLLEVQPQGADLFCFVEPTIFNMAAWEGFSDPAHPAVFQLRMGDQTRNDCGLHLTGQPPVNEPFATSPVVSTALLVPSKGGKSASGWLLRLHLSDDARPGHAMRNRRIDVLSGSRMVGKGRTDMKGNLQLAVPRGAKNLRVEDLTDAGLIIPLGSAGHRTPAARSPRRFARATRETPPGRNADRPA